MNVFKMVSAEIIGLALLIASASATLMVPGIGEFWLAVATAVTLFLLMYLRLHFESSARESEDASRLSAAK
jgi:hypothetical protein